MRKFLKYELDRYLSGRSGEVVEEMPLALVENQPYIHYRKGSVVMYALKDYLGEDVGRPRPWRASTTNWHSSRRLTRPRKEFLADLAAEAGTDVGRR